MTKLDLFHVRPACDQMVRRGVPNPAAQALLHEKLRGMRGFREQLDTVRAITTAHPEIMQTQAFAQWVRANDELLIRYIETGEHRWHRNK